MNAQSFSWNLNALDLCIGLEDVPRTRFLLVKGTIGVEACSCGRCDELKKSGLREADTVQVMSPITFRYLLQDLESIVIRIA